MSITAWLALTALAGYLIDAAGFGMQPWAALGAALALTGAVTIARRDHDPSAGDLLAWAGMVAFVIAVLVRLAWPSLLPPGRGPDLTHHLLLVDYIEQHGHLVHDRSLDGAMGEMAHYTPASHLLAVMAGVWFGTDGLHTFFPLVVVCAALTAGFVFLVARRHGLSIPFALIAVVLLMLPPQYFFGGFAHDSFLSQTVSTLFACAAWWGIVNWGDRASVFSAAIVAVFLVAAFLSWPIWIGPPLLLFFSMMWRAGLTPRERVTHLAVVLLPLAAIGLIHSWNRWGWVVIVRASGAVLHPSLESLGWLLPSLAIGGALAALADRRARSCTVMLFVIVLQGLVLFLVAKSQGAPTPYMAFKMVYLAIYPMAVLGAIAMARVAAASPGREAVGWILAALLVAFAARPALTAPRPIAIVDADLSAAGKWLRAKGGAACSDYLVADAETAYWLHLAVLGNPRASQRMREIDLYDPRAAVAPWITAEGRRYAIADLRLLPAEVRARVRIAAQFGSGAVITRQDATIKGCD